MARIEFPKGLEGSENLPRTRKLLQNCFWTQDSTGMASVLSRPGINELNNTAGNVARGGFVWNGSLYQVFSEDLIKITDADSGSFSVIGTIEGSNPIEFSIGFNFATIIVKGGKSYTLSKADALVDTSGNANFVPFVDVANVIGRTVYIPADGDPAKYSDVNTPGTIQVDSFFDAELLPDLNNAVFNFKDTLHIMGTDSIQPFRINPDSNTEPFLTINGGRILNGFIGALLEYNNTFLFIGREKDQDFGIYALGSGVAPKISNEAIDLLLSTYTQDELAEAIPGRFKWRGFDIATFTLRRDSFGFLKGNWFKLDTVFDGISRPWGGGFITQFEGKYYTAFGDKIGRFEKINTDYGNRITRIMDTSINQTDTEYFPVQSIELGIAQGFNAGKGSVALLLSNDNVLYGPPLYRDLGDIGQYEQKLWWNYAGGLGSYRGFMGIRFFTTEAIDFTNDYITANLRV